MRQEILQAKTCYQIGMSSNPLRRKILSVKNFRTKGSAVADAYRCEKSMHKGRLEAFTDGVIAVVITIMVLEMKVPQGSDFAALAPTLPMFLTYVLSYTNVAIFWNNLHHVLQVSERVDGRVLWANMFLLFWLSLIPFVIRWMDETDFAALPTAAYGFVLLMAAIGYLLLERMLIACNGAD
jgi:uncharacterized membrane protein